jgi:hypothetical protein
MFVETGKNFSIAQERGMIFGKAGHKIDDYLNQFRREVQVHPTNGGLDHESAEKCFIKLVPIVHRKGCDRVCGPPPRIQIGKPAVEISSISARIVPRSALRMLLTRTRIAPFSR